PWKRDGHIFIFNASGQMAAHWIFHAGWPCRWEVPRMIASGPEPAEEIVEIVHQGMTLQTPSGS
ncbi:MAG TPA: phage tail protein, partial [Fibrobacteria bacterium]|nr:phage tail protein [Fibrobacteria bacterium]